MHRDTCRHKPYGLLQPFPVPKKPWHTVTFDFIVKLPKTSRDNDSICVFVDKLTKLVPFVACKKQMSGRNSLNSTSTMSFVFMG
jgi:hypothetical protein